jgi:hypothetical protein
MRIKLNVRAHLKHRDSEKKAGKGKGDNVSV